MYFTTRLRRLKWIRCFLPLSLTTCLSSSSLSAKGAKRTTPVSVRVGAVALRRSLLSSFLST